MKIIATIEARMGSTRLPGKVLTDIGGMRSLECQISRLWRSTLIDEIVLATTVNQLDDTLVDFANEVGVHVYRGSENDVLGRILGAAKSVNGELQVQTTGDCPFIDPEIVDQVIQCYLDAHGKYDFVSNEMERTYPIGLDCRVFPVSVLEQVDRVCGDSIHRVHGSTYIYMGPGKEQYQCHNLLAPPNLLHPDWRWTLDTPEDLLFLQKVAAHFRERITEFAADELAQWLQKHPEVVAINSEVNQKSIEEG
ncbi:MAG: glycosyltransferase family protein [Desulfobulbaceae bacterium]|nr:glycosyltransferase family protein [Desulfobulbaceae bacterium]